MLAKVVQKLPSVTPESYYTHFSFAVQTQTVRAEEQQGQFCSFKCVCRYSALVQSCQRSAFQ